jgi:hypothetical protein
MSRPALLAIIVLCVVAMTACSGSSGDDASGDGGATDEPRLVSQTPGVATTIPGSTGDGAADPALDADAELVLEGRVTNRYDLEIGECFNEYVLDFTDRGSEDITTVVDCRGVHDAEVYHQFMVPGDQGAAYPGEDALDDLAESECYQRFGEFVGVPYEISELGLGFLRPTVETWTGAGVHREVTCFVEPYDSGLRLEGGSVAGRGL